MPTGWNGPEPPVADAPPLQADGIARVASGRHGDNARAMCVSPTSEALVRTAIGLAAEAGNRGDPPFGALLVSPHGEVVAMASNRQVSGDDPTAHAEIELLRAAARAGHRPPLAGYTVVVNAEPCSMCASALVKAAVSELVYGAPHESHLDPDIDVADAFASARRPPRVTAGILASEAAAEIAAFRITAPPPD